MQCRMADLCALVFLDHGVAKDTSQLQYLVAGHGCIQIQAASWSRKCNCDGSEALQQLALVQFPAT